MFTSFSTAVSSMKAHETAIDVVGNNLANLNTSGYKTVSLQFRDLVSQSMNGGLVQVGGGVDTPLTYRDFAQGAIQNGGLMTAAIQGSGFFVLQDPGNSGNYLYTRDGHFALDSTGYLTSQTGLKVLGADGKPILVNTGGAIPPAATQNISASFNLNSDAATGTMFNVPITVVDSKGAPHQLTLTLTKAAGVNTWDYSAALESSANATVTATGSLTFDTDGKLVLAGTPPATSATIDIAFPAAAGTADMSLEWSFVDAAGAPVITQYATSSSIAATSQDGFQASTLSHVGITDDGNVTGTYADGRRQVLGQLGLANISNPDTLRAAGDNNLRPSFQTITSGPAKPNPGSILGGKLEASTVDIATEFTNLMVFQRGYQASSKVITTTDQISQDTINLIR